MLEGKINQLDVVIFPLPFIWIWPFLLPMGHYLSSGYVLFFFQRATYLLPLVTYFLVRKGFNYGFI